VPAFEYKTVLLSRFGKRKQVEVAAFDETLAEHGAEGWELVTLKLAVDVFMGHDGHLLVFKRVAA